MPVADLTELVIVDRSSIADDTVLLTLARPDGGELPLWQPGAHIDLHLGQAPHIIRQYSLCSSPRVREHYQIAVLLDRDGRGGSAHVHTHLHVGERVMAGGPRNNFELVDAPSYFFVGGGIGITPLLPMIEEAQRRGADWSLLYGGRRRTSMAFTRELAAFASRVVLWPADEYGLLEIANSLVDLPDETLVYCCGPESLLQAVEAQCASYFLSGRLHLERFAPVVRGCGSGDRPFEVEFAKSGVTRTVAVGQSILEVAEEAEVPVIYSCEEGTCGSCETAVLEGLPDHRDAVLNKQEQQRGDRLMICVSRAMSAKLVLDV